MRSAAAAPARAARAPPLRVARRHAPRAAAPPPRASGAGGERDRIARDVLGAPGYDSLPADLKAAVAETAGDEQAGPVESLREEGFAANLAQPEMMQGYARLGANWPVEGQDDDVPFDPYCDLETRAEVTGPAGRRTGRAGMSEGADG